MEQKIYDTYTAILREELIPALGCTEPIAIAYAAAKAREVLGRMPERIVVQCSGNIIKNVKGVIVPATGDLKGIDTSAILGSLLGGSFRKLEVLTAATEQDVARTRELLRENICEVHLLEGVSSLQVIVKSFAGDDCALVEIQKAHTNITRVEKNGETCFSQETQDAQALGADRSQLTLEQIYEYATTVELSEIEEIISRQIELNTRIANEGFAKNYGANVGSCLLKHYGDDVKVRARAWPAAGSDARMGGCVLPVVINSGSGNQGMTVSLPVVIFAEELHVGKEPLYRALVLANLVSIYLKSGIGKLSAYCGAVSAACGAGAGITYLHGGSLAMVASTITNLLGNVSGIVCDGAKPSCAAKIASAVDAAVMAHYMTQDQMAFQAGEGLIANDVDQTIQNIGRLGREGMKTTDVEILHMMLEN